MKILTVVPARSGSKAIKNKNIKLLNGKPLVTYGIETALASSHNMRTIVSTDSTEIAEIAKNSGAEIPFIRPKELSGDDISIIPVICHAVKHLQDQDWNPDIVVSLQSTAPFTSVKSLDEGIDRLIYNKHIDSSVSVSKISKPHPFRSYSLTKDQTIEPLTKYTSEKFLQRQDLPLAYSFTGGFFIRRTKLLHNWNAQDFCLGNKIAAVVTPEYESIDINSIVDFFLAETILANIDKLNSGLHK